jgi:hypothetical protein
MTAYLKIAIFISTLLLQLPANKTQTPVVPVMNETAQNFMSVSAEQTLSPAMVGAALADY